MIIWYIYILICGFFGLVYSIIWPNFVEYNTIWEQFFRIGQYVFSPITLLQAPYSLDLSFFIASIWIILWISGFVVKNPKIRKNLFLISGFIILWIFSLYCGFIIWLFKEYIFNDLWQYFWIH